jgi:hypothetical protein
MGQSFDGSSGRKMSEFNQYFPEIVRELLGDRPTDSKNNGKRLRFGTNGSKSIDLDEGRWYDHEAETGGGPLDLITHIRGGTIAEAIKWLESVGIKPESKPIPSKRNGTLTATYNYVDEHGELKYQVLRYDNPKTFKQRAGDGSWSIKGIKPIPYRLPEMLSQQNTVLIVEGEKDVDALRAIGLTATCNSGGAGKFPDDLVPYFRNRVVIILPDNDKAGADHAHMVACKLRNVATSIRIIELPDLPGKGDVSDWLNAGGTKETLVNICKAAPLWEYVEPAQADPTIIAPEIVTNYWEPLKHCNDKGKPLAHIENLKQIIDRLGINVRYNVISKDDEILIPGKSFSVDNKDNASLAWIISECSRFGYPTAKVPEFLTFIADQNLYNPVATWIESKAWDGVVRIVDLFETITCVNNQDNDLKEILIRRWLLSAVAAAFSPTGVAAPGILVIQGEQYLGKTKWFKSLVPEELELLKEGMMLRPDDKDSVEQACSFWMVELGELDSTFRKSDIAALKAFITNKSDVLRRAYARKKSHYARRTVFFGSVNPKQFLNDPTGNRRFWTIEAATIKHTHDIDMQQLWAEVLHYYKEGESYFLTAEEMDLLNAHNEQFTSIDPIAERIDTRLAWDDPESLWEWKTVTDILISVGIDRPTRSDATAAGGYIGKRNGNQRKRSNGLSLVKAPKNRATSVQPDF